MNSNSFAGIIAVALVIIALNMTYSNFHKPAEKPSVELEQKVLPVIGRAWSTFDEFGISSFLVKDGDELKLVPYEKAMVGNTELQPKFMTMVKFSNGKIAWSPLTVEPFH